MYFSDLLLKLQEFWKNKGCNIVMPYDFPSGAGTFHPATLLRRLFSEVLTRGLGMWRMWLRAAVRQTEDTVKTRTDSGVIISFR